jgi:hypothetical protein
MFTHRADRLQGPVTQDRKWWPRPKPVAKGRGRAASSYGIRVELVQRVRQEIAAGTYETPEKWEAALDRLLDRLD